MPIRYSQRTIDRLTGQVHEVVVREGGCYSNVIAEEVGFKSARQAAWFIKKHMRDDIQIEHEQGTRLIFLPK